MILLTTTDLESAGANLRGKAGGLLSLSPKFAVPPFCVLQPSSRGDREVDSATVDAIRGAIGEGPYAVRSSANVEDSAAHSYAGMFETLLGVSLSDLKAAVAYVVDSGSADRVQSYREVVTAGKSAGLEIEMTVIVQRMVRADRAGVCLTQRSRLASELLIEAVLGLGETLVSGEVDPDRYVVARNPLRMTIEHVSCQTLARLLTPEGVVDVAVPPLDRNSPKLLETEVLEIAATACAVEATLDIGACDIEWAYESDTLLLLQARPYSSVNYYHA